jgi:hypothetical protein
MNESTPLVVKQWVKRKFAAHAFPRIVHFEENLPTTPSGKIQRGVLRSGDKPKCTPPEKHKTSPDRSQQRTRPVAFVPPIRGGNSHE